MASKSFISRSCILIAIIAIALISVIQAQEHVHEGKEYIVYCYYYALTYIDYFLIRWIST